MAAALVGDFGAAVGAAVEQHVDAAVAVPRHDHRLPPEFGGEIIARIGDLAGMADEQPGPPENPLHLQFEDIRIGIDAAVDASGLDQFCDRSGVPIHHGAFRYSGGRAAARCVFTRACWYRSARAATTSVIPESAKPRAYGPTAADSSSRAMLWQTMGVQRRSEETSCRLPSVRPSIRRDRLEPWSAVRREGPAAKAALAAGLRVPGPPAGNTWPRSWPRSPAPRPQRLNKAPSRNVENVIMRRGSQNLPKILRALRVGVGWRPGSPDRAGLRGGRTRTLCRSGPLVHPCAGKRLHRNAGR